MLRWAVCGEMRAKCAGESSVKTLGFPVTVGRCRSEPSREIDDRASVDDASNQCDAKVLERGAGCMYHDRACNL